MTERETFALNLNRIMQQKGITQSDIVAEFDCSSATVSDWVNGKKYPRIDKMQALADFLGVKLSDLREEHKLGNLIDVTGMVPIYGTIPAGYPNYAEQYIEDYLPVTVLHPEEYLCLRVKGDSMIGAGIVDGSKVLIHKQSTADNGQIVACRVNGDEATLKRFKQQGNTVVLMPENPSYDPRLIPIGDFLSGEAQIIGVVKQIIIDI